MQMEEERLENKKKKEKMLQELYDSIRKSNIKTMSIPEGKERKAGN